MQENKRPKSSLTREGCKSPQRLTQHLPTVCKGDAKQQESSNYLKEEYKTCPQFIRTQG